MTETELKKAILEYLEENRLMTVATSKGDTPWASTVFYAYDDKLNLYFMSDKETRKTVNILKNPKVAVTIDREQPAPGKVRGIQLEGAAQISDDPSVFLARHAWGQSFLPNSKIIKITPSKIIYLSDEEFGPRGHQELVLKNG